MLICKAEQTDMGYGHFFKAVKSIYYQKPAETQTAEFIVSRRSGTSEFPNQSVHKPFYRNTVLLKVVHGWLFIAYNRDFVEMKKARLRELPASFEYTRNIFVKFSSKMRKYLLIFH